MTPPSVGIWSYIANLLASLQQELDAIIWNSHGETVFLLSLLGAVVVILVLVPSQERIARGSSASIRPTSKECSPSPPISHAVDEPEEWVDPPISSIPGNATSPPVEICAPDYIASVELGDREIPAMKSSAPIPGWATRENGPPSSEQLEQRERYIKSRRDNWGGSIIWEMNRDE